MRNILISAAVCLIFVSCSNIHGSGNIVTEKRNVKEFKGISTGGAYDVELTNGPVSVQVEADDNVQQYIVTEVEGGVLKIRSRDNFGLSDAHVKIYVSASAINMLKSSGAANINAKDLLKSDGKITLETSGAAAIEAEVDAPEVEAESSGASKIELKGRTREYTAKASGSADIKSSGLLTERTDAGASGASSIHVHASVNLTAEASGSASIYYRGGATVQQKTSGAADVKKEED
jgi:Putative auto-transporter adhesin, head GIN domain